MKGATPNTTAIDTVQYTGTVAWNDITNRPVSGKFVDGAVYKALVTLTAKSGYVFTGVTENSFTYSGATSVTNAADSGTVTITFPAVGTEAGSSAVVIVTTTELTTLTKVLANLAANTAGSPYTVVILETGTTGTTVAWKTINDAVQTSKKYVNLDLSACTATEIDSDFSSIKDNGYIKEIILPDSLTAIGDNAFYGCTSLTSVTIGNSVESIGANAFLNCSNLTSVTIPASVASIGDYAFSYCRGLTSVTFEFENESGVTLFGNNAFPEGSLGRGGNGLKTEYVKESGGAGPYTRAANGDTWTKKTGS